LRHKFTNFRRKNYSRKCQIFPWRIYCLRHVRRILQCAI